MSKFVIEYLIVMLSKTFYVLSSKMFKIFHNGSALLISLAIFAFNREKTNILAFIQVIVSMSICHSISNSYAFKNIMHSLFENVQNIP